ncbi:hypothetical protein ACFL6E_07780, partial [Candidatus Neomarinimicrobiota bacterium]
RDVAHPIEGTLRQAQRRLHACRRENGPTGPFLHLGDLAVIAQTTDISRQNDRIRKVVYSSHDLKRYIGDKVQQYNRHSILHNNG